MSVDLVAQGRIHNREMLDEYLEKVVDTLTPDMKIHAIDETPEIVEGPCDRPRTVIIEFPDKAAFRAWYDSPGYQEVVGLRTNSVDGWLLVAEGFVPPSDG